MTKNAMLKLSRYINIMSKSNTRKVQIAKINNTSRLIAHKLRIPYDSIQTQMDAENSLFEYISKYYYLEFQHEILKKDGINSLGKLAGDSKRDMHFYFCGHYIAGGVWIMQQDLVESLQAMIFTSEKEYNARQVFVSILLLLSCIQSNPYNLVNLVSKEEIRGILSLIIPLLWYYTDIISRRNDGELDNEAISGKAERRG